MARKVGFLAVSLVALGLFIHDAGLCGFGAVLAAVAVGFEKVDAL